MTAQASQQKLEQVARPLRVLVPLIQKDLQQAREASERAAQPYYQAAAEKMAEARTQMSYSEFLAWAWRHFKIRETQVRRYLSIANSTINYSRDRGGSSASMSERLSKIGQAPRGAQYGGAAWREPIRQIIDKVDVDTLNLRKAEMVRADEREAQRKLALQLIDIGFKALASKLHPDKGGSRDAMSRLNQVRDRLKLHA